jgi:radical SAM superfamily enzyme YgiQ (UPF0313 family)
MPMIEKIAHKAVLIYPEFDTQDTFWSYSTSLEMYGATGEFGLPKSLLPPLGLMGLFNHLKPYYDRLCLIDKNVDPRPLVDLIEDADHVFMGGMLAQENNLLQHAIAVKKANKILIIGGTAITPMSPLVELADYVVENEVEGVIDELLEGLRAGETKKYYKGSFNRPELFFQPDYASINMRNYVHMAVQISRGCPENCEFCDIPFRFGKAFRVTPQGKTAASFQQMNDLGWKGQVFVVDDNFIAHPRKALQILKDLFSIGESIGYHHPKYTELTLRLADDSEIMQALRHWFNKAFFINGFYGVETPNKASLVETKKRQNLRGERSLVEKLSFISEQTGAGVMMGMIYGFDHDTNDSVDEFIDFVNASNAPIVMAGLLNALPCTGLMERMEAEGRYIQSSSGNNSDGVINFIPYNFSVQQAEQNYLRILEGIYHPQAYFNRVMRHLECIDPLLQSNFRAGNDSVSYLVKILSKKHALIYWRHIPQVLKIAIRRCRFNPGCYKAILAEFISLCGQYTHFTGQINTQRKRISEKNYPRWQQFSWRELKASKSKLSAFLELKHNNKIR